MWLYRYKMFCFTNLNGITPPYLKYSAYICSDNQRYAKLKSEV